MSGTNGQRVLTLDEIRKAEDARSRFVPVPQWGEGAGVRMRSIPVGDYEDLLAEFKDTEDSDRVEQVRFMRELTARAIVEPPLSVNDLRHFSQEAYVVLVNAAKDLHGLDRAADDKAAASFPEGPDEEVPVPADA